jgi:mono/diheme cytochrome c family protein
MKTAGASMIGSVQLRRFLCLSLMALVVSACQSTKTPTPEVIVLVDDSGNVSNGRVSFKDDIAPLLQARCVSCHYDEGPLTGLSFQRRASLLEDSDGRSILVPGDPEKSTLFLVTVMPDYFVEAMPPTGHRLSDVEASTIYRWIAQGADWPKDQVLEPGAAP